MLIKIINVIVLWLQLFDTNKDTIYNIKLYRNFAEIKLSCDLLSRNHQIESNITGCNKASINSCATDEISIKIERRIYVFNTLKKILTKNYEFICKYNDKRIIMKIFKYDLSDQIVFKNSVISNDNFCPIEFIQFNINGQICSKHNSATYHCSKLGIFSNDSIRLINNDEVKIHIKCAQDYVDYEQILPYEYSLKNDNNLPLTLSCENIYGNLKLLENFKEVAPPPSYIKQDKYLFIINIQNQTEHVTFTCSGNTERTFFVDVLKEKVVNIETLIDIKSFCAIKDLKLYYNNDTCNMNDKSCDHLFISDENNIINLESLKFKQSGTYIFVCVQRYSNSYYQIKLTCTNNDKMCNTSNKCLHKSLICNGYEDCDNDEEKCSNTEKITEIIPKIYQLKCTDYNLNNIKVIEIDKTTNRINLVNKKNINSLNSLEDFKTEKYFFFDNKIYIGNNEEKHINVHTCTNGDENIINTFYPNNVHYFISYLESSELLISCSNFMNIKKDFKQACEIESNCSEYLGTPKKFLFKLKEKISRLECMEKDIATIYHLKNSQSNLINGLSIYLKNICAPSIKIEIKLKDQVCSVENKNENECSNFMFIHSDIILMKKEVDYEIKCINDDYTIRHPISFKCPKGYYTCNTNKKCIPDYLINNLVIQCEDDKVEVPLINSYKIYTNNFNHVIINCSFIDGEIVFRIGKRECSITGVYPCPNFVKHQKVINLIKLDFKHLANNYFYCQSHNDLEIIKEFIIIETPMNFHDALYPYNKYCPTEIGSLQINTSEDNYTECFLGNSNVKDNKVFNENQNNCQKLNIFVKKDTDESLAIFNGSLLYTITCTTEYFISTYSVNFKCSINYFWCQKTSLCLSNEHLCNGINDCNNDEEDCSNVIYIPQFSLNFYELPFLENAELMSIENNKLNKVNESMSNSNLRYLLTNNRIIVEKIGLRTINDHLYSNKDVKYILKFIEENTFYQINLSIDHEIKIECKKMLRINLVDVPIILKENKLITGDYKIYLDDYNYQIKFITDKIKSIDCYDKQLSNKRFNLNYNDENKIEQISRNQFKYENFCKNNLFIRMGSSTCSIPNNNKINPFNCYEFLSVDTSAYQIITSYAIPVKIECTLDQYTRTEIIHPECQENYYKCPVVHKCLISNEVFNLKLQCHPSIIVNEEIIEVRTLPNLKIKLDCSELESPFDIFIGKKKICSSNDCLVMNIKNGVLEFVPEILKHTKYSCEKTKKTKSFIIFYENEIQLYSNVVDIKTICNYKDISFNIMKSNKISCSVYENKAKDVKICQSNNIQVEDGQIIFGESNHYVLECTNNQFTSKLLMQIECSHEEYFHCDNNKCLLKSTIFSLKQQCRNEEPSINNINIFSNGENIEIVCNTNNNAYSLYVGLKEVCPINEQCLFPFVRINDNIFSISKDVLKIPNVKFFCSQNEFKNSEKSYTIKIEENKVINQSINIQDIIRNSSIIKKVHFYSKKHNEKCSTENGSSKNCEIIGIRVKKGIIKFFHSDNFTLIIFTDDFVTKLDYRVIINEIQQYGENKNSPTKSNSNIIVIIISSLILITIGLIVIAIVLFKRRQSKKDIQLDRMSVDLNRRESMDENKFNSHFNSSYVNNCEKFHQDP